MKFFKSSVRNKGVYAFISLFVLLSSCKTEKSRLANLEKGVSDIVLEVEYIKGLDLCEKYIDSLTQTNSKKNLEKFYLKSREVFKRMEPILAFHDIENYTFFNAPNILKVEEEDATDIKIRSPKSFQVLEELIFADSLDVTSIHKTGNLLKNRLALLANNTDLKYMKDYHVLWVLRNGFVRIALTGITGFDSPVLENSLAESATVYETLMDIVKFNKHKFNNTKLYDQWIGEIIASMALLNQSDFESFDRYQFIKQHTHKQLQLFNSTVKDWGVSFPFTMAINNDAESLFSEETFNQNYFSDKGSPEMTPERIHLGKTLFNDKSLSRSGTISCASCHDSDMAFTDGKKVSDDQVRNSPTLTYASLQQSFFYDRRAGGLEGQIVSVVKNDTEFHSDLKSLSEAVSKSEKYKEAFGKAYLDSITEFNIRNAIANYIRSLNGFDSKFDNNINGLENSLSENEIKGFNLFMGKAKCATCHFAPVFNGTVPPNFAESEIELLGVPMANDTINAIVDGDLGAYNLFGTEQRKFFFKTPTIRNIEKTGPYMHNGVYTTLEEVIDFYDRGGGAGIGIDLEHQTLPSERLELSDEEQKELVDFMKTLTDPQDSETTENNIAKL